MELAIKRSSSPAADAPFQVETVVGACMAVRGLALGLINKDNAKRILTKELGIALLNGSVWGGVMAGAMMLNLLVAAMAGYFAPTLIVRFGRDPAFGSAVLTTFITDSMGFFIFLGLATVVLL